MEVSPFQHTQSVRVIWVPNLDDFLWGLCITIWPWVKILPQLPSFHINGHVQTCSNTTIHLGKPQAFNPPKMIPSALWLKIVKYGAPKLIPSFHIISPNFPQNEGIPTKMIWIRIRWAPRLGPGALNVDPFFVLASKKPSKPHSKGAIFCPRSCCDPFTTGSPQLEAGVWPHWKGIRSIVKSC
jgi:hypothetical protein